MGVWMIGAGLLSAGVAYAAPTPSGSAGLSSGVGSATTGTATTGACSGGDGGEGSAADFFGLKGWYAYLDCETVNGRQTVAGSNFEKDKITKTIWTIILTILTDLFFIVGLLAVVMIIYGGFQYVLSAGDAGAAAKAKKTIVGAVVGLILGISAHMIVNTILGIFSSGGGFQ